MSLTKRVLSGIDVRVSTHLRSYVNEVLFIMFDIFVQNCEPSDSEFSSHGFLLKAVEDEIVGTYINKSMYIIFR